MVGYGWPDTKRDEPEYERLKTRPPALLMTHNACIVMLPSYLVCEDFTSWRNFDGQ
jgi:hypothetical protein